MDGPRSPDRESKKKTRRNTNAERERWIQLAASKEFDQRNYDGILGLVGKSDLSKPATQDNVGVQMARMNLLARGAACSAVQINPGDAMAHNNGEKKNDRASKVDMQSEFQRYLRKRSGSIARINTSRRTTPATSSFCRASAS